jgi:putative Mg2+ transporter-C (MgtC) family protein
MSGNELGLLARILVAGLIGYLVGWQREYVARREAGTRTFSLVALTSALVTGLASDLFGTDSASRVIANILVGVGFLGGGMILKEQGRARGLTTAAGVWAVAAVGMTIGSGRLGLGVLVGLLVLLVFSADRVQPLAGRWLAALHRRPRHPAAVESPPAPAPREPASLA